MNDEIAGIHRRLDDLILANNRDFKEIFERLGKLNGGLSTMKWMLAFGATLTVPLLTGIAILLIEHSI